MTFFKNLYERLLNGVKLSLKESHDKKKVIVSIGGTAISCNKEYLKEQILKDRESLRKVKESFNK